ncbi:MAG: T9SS type A sorting domain-containing protein [Candidatus Eisenbacteria bacterium]|uniref:T9SS type A sorting domain-containing protein n=1 Tax=Eiseniibacteriota bacterium TaxID=2212470 RepID=A0A948W5U2_UNCEI|nr:T9SS type A sorting domain-containing protein [Candidatus Eisenbacteria bacterium]
MAFGVSLLLSSQLHIDVSITGNGYTHEHDWEWIYIIVGWNEVLNCHVGFAAVLSAHSAHNRDAMMNQSRTYLFPRVVLRDLMEYPYLSHSRVLSDDWISDETDISTMLTRAGVKVHPMGNEMSELATAPSDHGFEVVDVVPRGWELGEGCGEGDETYMCFGDPQNCDVTIFDICHSESECEDEKYVPWARDGLGENSPVPYYFNVPETIAIEGEYDVEIGNVEFSVIGQPGELLVSWNWFHSRPKPESFVLITRSEDGSGYCRIGEIVENGSVKYNCIISDCTDQRELITDNWRICSSCLTEGNTAGNSIELWVKWPSGRVNKLAMSEPILDDTIEISPKLGIKGNPVHNFCNISYFLPKRNQLSLSVYDIHGRRIRELYAGTSEPGWHSSTWNINNGEDSSLASGVFWVCLEWSGGMVTKQVTVLK